MVCKMTDDERMPEFIYKHKKYSPKLQVVIYARNKKYHPILRLV